MPKEACLVGAGFSSWFANLVSAWCWRHGGHGCFAEVGFTHANAVEKIHHGLYQQAIEAVKAGQKLKSEPYFVCQVCGNIVAGEAPEACPICGAARSQFKRVG